MVWDSFLNHTDVGVFVRHEAREKSIYEVYNSSKILKVTDKDRVEIGNTRSCCLIESELFAGH